VSALLLSLSLPSPDYLRPGGPARWVQNQYNTLDGGAVAAVAETVGLACARAAAGDKEMFLGELSTAYLAAARVNVSFLQKLSNTLICRFCLPIVSSVAIQHSLCRIESIFTDSAMFVDAISCGSSKI